MILAFSQSYTHSIESFIVGSSHSFIHFYFVGLRWYLCDSWFFQINSNLFSTFTFYRCATWDTIKSDDYVKTYNIQFPRWWLRNLRWGMMNSRAYRRHPLYRNFVELSLFSRMENNLSRSGSRSSSVCELEKDFSDMEIMKSRTNRRNVMLRTQPARKAKRVRFFRNGDKFYSGVIIPVLPERYRWAILISLIKLYWPTNVVIKWFRILSLIYTATYTAVVYHDTLGVSICYCAIIYCIVKTSKMIHCMYVKHQ